MKRDYVGLRLKGIEVKDGVGGGLEVNKKNGILRGGRGWGGGYSSKAGMAGGLKKIVSKMIVGISFRVRKRKAEILHLVIRKYELIKRVIDLS